MAAFLDKLNLEAITMDFQQFIVRFGLDYRMTGKWEFQTEKKETGTKVRANSARQKHTRRCALHVRVSDCVLAGAGGGEAVPAQHACFQVVWTRRDPG